MLPIDRNTNDTSANDTSANDISANDISANDISANDISANDISANDISANDISANDISANDISANDISANDISANGTNIKCSRENKFVRSLLNVSKPLRYTGGESGSVVKDHTDRLKFCLTFPDIYEIGMSHLGFRILYTNLNSIEEITCERFFAPWPDAYEELGDDIMVSLESHTHIKEFDVIGFSMQYELAYTTAIQLLKMAKIPIKSADRCEDDPIIIAGGGCMLNPAPLIDFIDIFFFGEMDSELSNAMVKLHKIKNNGATRKEQLEMLNNLPYTYIPSIDRDKKARREIYAEFATTKNRQLPLVPMMPIVQDRVAVEISRGCTNGCRFCQAGMIYRPVREKTVSNLCTNAFALLDETGYQELSILSLDTGDYSQLESLLSTLNSNLNDKNISLSLPSMRADTVNPELMERVGSVRKSGFTIAPEAGTQRLRDIINKNITEEQIINAAVYAKNAGYNSAKLYFMCGLPYETDEDIIGIATLAGKIKNATRGGRHFNITISVSNFVPKSHTPFERVGQVTPVELRRRHSILIDELRKYKLQAKFHDVTASLIEATLSRGDSRWGQLLETAVNEGFYLDAWREYFSRDKWLALFEQHGYSPEEFACITYDDSAPLPWSMVNCGISSKWLLQERDKAENALTTKDCRAGSCPVCGVCAVDKENNIRNNNVIAKAEAPATLSSITMQTRAVSQDPIYGKYEVSYDKLGVSSLMSALDLSKVFSHMFLSSDIELKYSQGFNPQPRIVILAPIPVGVEGVAEKLLFEADLTGVSKDEVANRLKAHAPAGMNIRSVEDRSWSPNLSNFQMTFKFDEDSFKFIVGKLNDGKAVYEKVNRRGNVRKIDLHDFLLKIDEQRSKIEIQIDENGGFHFPEFFKKSGYKAIPYIVRTDLKPSSVS